MIASAQSGHGLGSSHWPGSRHQREGKERISCGLWVLLLVRPCFSYTSSSAPPLPLSLHPPIGSGFSHLTNKQQNKANYFPFLFTVKLLLEVVFIFLTSPILTLFFHSFTPMIFQKLFSWKHQEPANHRGVWPFLSLHSSWLVWTCDSIETLKIS